MNKSIILSSAGLKNVILNRSKVDDEFKFLIGNKDFRMKSIFAEFISPIISKLHNSDPSIDHIDINDFFSKNIENFPINHQEIFTDDAICLLEQLSQGYSISINTEQSLKLRFISIILENEELYSQINDKFPTVINESNIDLYAQNLRNLYYYSKISKDFHFSDIIDYLSEHFYSLNQSDLIGLPKSLLLLIISNDHLKLENEDSLLDFIELIFEHKNEEQNNEKVNKIEFYEKVNFCELSENKFKEFLRNFDISEMTNDLWRNLSGCFFPIIPNNEQNPRYFSSEKVFKYDGNIQNCFHGIIHHLTEKYHGNVSEKNVVDVTSSSVYDNRYAKYVVDLEDDRHYFTSDCRQNSWLKLDFNQVHVEDEARRR